MESLMVGRRVRFRASTWFAKRFIWDSITDIDADAAQLMWLSGFA